MIELVSDSRCTGCNICVAACPTNVFEAVPGGAPRIARQQDCQTCFMCEAWCPEDAIFVAPQADASVAVDEQAVTAAALLGSYRASLGWGRGREPTAQLDASFRLMRR